MRDRHSLPIAALTTVALLVPMPAVSQGSSAGTEDLAPPEEWIVAEEQTSPLRTPPASPLQITEGRITDGDLVRAPDGSQVAWTRESPPPGETEVVVADVWSGGRRVVHRTPSTDSQEIAAVSTLAFTRDSTALLLVAGDEVRRVDLTTGAVTVLLVHDSFALDTDEHGPISAVDIEQLATGDIVVYRACHAESCGPDTRPLLWRHDTGNVVELPHNGALTNNGRAIVTVDNVDGETVLGIAPVRRPTDRRDVARLDGPASLMGIRSDDQVIALGSETSGRVELRYLADGEVAATAPPPADGSFAGGRWSPDGRRFATTAIWHDPFERQPWVLDLDTGEATPVAERDELLAVSGWSDDGTLLVVNEGEMWRIRDDGSRVRVTTLVPDDTYSDDAQPRRPVVGVVGRYAGEDRVATATALSRAAFEAADTVVVARADLYPDALSGSALAGSVNGPVLLTGSDQLDGRVAAEVERLGPSTAYVLGTTDVMSRRVERDLRAAGVEQVIRLGGADRFDTAARGAGEVGADHDRVFLVEGQHVNPARGWPDAVAVAGEAAATATPVLLATTDRIPDATREAIADLGVERVTIVGGPVAISREVEEQIRAMGVAVDRVAGDTRYATSVSVASRQDDVSLPFVVTGSNWPDALAAGPAAAHVGGTVLLVPPDSITASRHVEAFVHDRAATIDRVAVAGSTGVVSQRIVRELDRIVRGG